MGHTNTGTDGQSLAMLDDNDYSSYSNLNVKDIRDSILFHNETHKNKVQCVLFTGDNTVSFADTMAGAVRCCVVTTSHITQWHAAVFNARFYSELSRGITIGQAVQSANIQLDADELTKRYSASNRRVFKLCSREISDGDIILGSMIGANTKANADVQIQSVIATNCYIEKSGCSQSKLKELLRDAIDHKYAHHWSSQETYAVITDVIKGDRMSSNESKKQIDVGVTVEPSAGVSVSGSISVDATNGEFTAAGKISAIDKP